MPTELLATNPFLLFHIKCSHPPGHRPSLLNVTSKESLCQRPTPALRDWDVGMCWLCFVTTQARKADHQGRKSLPVQRSVLEATMTTITKQSGLGFCKMFPQELFRSLSHKAGRGSGHHGYPILTAQGPCSLQVLSHLWFLVRAAGSLLPGLLFTPQNVVRTSLLYCANLTSLNRPEHFVFV